MNATHSVPLTAELEAKLRAAVDLKYIDIIGTESHERSALLAEIDRLRGALACAHERCALIAEGFEKNRDWVPGSLYEKLRKEVAPEIRKTVI